MKHTLLLVEDELGIRETVKIFLKSQKCETKINQNVQKKTNLKTSLNNLEKIE